MTIYQIQNPENAEIWDILLELSFVKCTLINQYCTRLIKHKKKTFHLLKGIVIKTVMYIHTMRNLVLDVIVTLVLVEPEKVGVRVQKLK